METSLKEGILTTVGATAACNIRDANSRGATTDGNTINRRYLNNSRDTCNTRDANRSRYVNNIRDSETLEKPVADGT
jgi:hypothetical protein